MSLKRPVAVRRPAHAAEETAERPGFEAPAGEKTAGPRDPRGVLLPAGTQTAAAEHPGGVERPVPEGVEMRVDRLAPEARPGQLGAETKRPVATGEKDAQPLAGKTLFVEPTFVFEAIEDRLDPVLGGAVAAEAGGEFPPPVVAAGEAGERPGVERPLPGAVVFRPRFPAFLVLRNRPMPPRERRREARGGARAAPRPRPR